MAKILKFDPKKIKKPKKVLPPTKILTEEESNDYVNERLYHNRFYDPKEKMPYPAVKLLLMSLALFLIALFIQFYG